MKSFYLLLLFPIFAFGQNLTPPTISHQSGFYADEFYLHISHPDPNVTILYTLDGSEPKFENLDGKVWNYKKVYPTNPGDAFGELLSDTSWTYKYIDSILVKNRSVDRNRYSQISTSYYTNQQYLDAYDTVAPLVRKHTTLRVVAYKDSIYSGEINNYYFYTHTPNVSPHSLPIVSLNIDPKTWYGYEDGMNVPGKTFDDFRILEPHTNINPWFPSNFRVSGSGSEKRINFIYIDNSQEKLNQFVGVRFKGSGSRYLPNRQLRFYAKNEYGVSNFDHKFFDNSDYNQFKRIVLRNSGQDAARTGFQDAFVHKLVRNLKFNIQEYRPVIVYISGEYHGIYNLRDDFSHEYFKRVFDVNKNQLDYLENIDEISEGDAVHYNSTMSYAELNDLSETDKYNHFNTLIDVENYTDYFITEIFVNNQDWPTNNIEYWRKRVSYDSTAPYGHDGRWRWMFKDLDDSFGISWPNGGITTNDLKRITTLSENDDLNKMTLFLRKLLDNPNYETYFINRFSDLLNTTFLPARMNSFIDDAKHLIDSEIEEHIERWNPLGVLGNYHVVSNINVWENNIEALRNFAEFRSVYMMKHLKERFTLQNDAHTILDVSDTIHGHIQINTIDIIPTTDGVNSNPYPWVGNYFKNVPITLKAHAKPGYVFSHWSGEIHGTLPEFTVNLDQDMYIKANFITEEENDLAVNKLSKDDQGIIVYPNPFNDNITVLSDVYDGNYVVYSIDGKQMLSGDFTSKTIHLESLESGVFILEINTQGKTFNKRIIKK